MWLTVNKKQLEYQSGSKEVCVYVCSGCGVSNLAGFFHTSSITGDTCTARLCVHMVQLKSGLCVSEPSSTQG